MRVKFDSDKEKVVQGWNMMFSLYQTRKIPAEEIFIIVVSGILFLLICLQDGNRNEVLLDAKSC